MMDARDVAVRGNGKTLFQSLIKTVFVSSVQEVKTKGQKVPGMTQGGEDRQRRRFEDENKLLFFLFKLCGVVALRKVNGQSVVSKIRFIIFYMMWIIWPLIGFSAALLGYSLFCDAPADVQSHNRIMEGSFFILGFAVFPALQAYSLKYINKCLPEVLQKISELDDVQEYFKTPLKVFGPPHGEKCRNKIRQAVNGVSPVKQMYPDQLFHWLPLTMILLSLSAFLVYWSIGYVTIVNIDTLNQEMPILIFNFAYQCFPFVTTIFVVIFIRWHARVYQTVHKFCQDTSATWTKREILVLCNYVDKLQDIFSQMSAGFFRYTLGMNLLTVMISAIACTAKILQDSNNIIYLEPLACNIFLLVVLCESSSTIMDKYEALLLVLKEEIRRHQRHSWHEQHQHLLVLRDNLLESPPEVVTFGGYRTNRGFLVTILGFVVSYALLVDQVTNRRAECAHRNIQVDNNSSSMAYVNSF
ncbi:uncharacterized protein [Procambarus clarkii]|uniref:uncharacterized protein n=1 Tax=Procambarus clarkii TaxID=6728 RepID=UPI003743E273